MTIHIARYVRQEYALNELINHLIFLDSTERRVSKYLASYVGGVEANKNYDILYLKRNPLAASHVFHISYLP